MSKCENIEDQKLSASNHKAKYNFSLRHSTTKIDQGKTKYWYQ